MTGGQLRMRHLAPAGAPIRLPDLARWTRLAIAGGDVAASLRQEFCDRFGVRHSFLTSTGRAGMTLLLRAMRRLAPSQRDEVVVPSYTCYSVAASVVKAGLRPRIVDIAPDTLDYSHDDLGRTDMTRVLAIVATNLYGFPNDLPALSRFARQHGVFLVDDAAQAMGARVGGRSSGTWGDAGLFSFDKGKNVAAIDGGVVVTSSDDLADALRHEAAGLPAAGAGEAAGGVAKALVYFLMLRPWLYWIPNRVPQLELGKTTFTTEFPLTQPCRPLVALGRTMMRHLDEFTRARVATGGALLEAVGRVPGIRTLRAVDGSVPVHLRLPIFVADPEARRRAFVALADAGIGASGSYPASLADVEALQPFIAPGHAGALGGRRIAREIITLPTHAFVRAGDIARASRALAAALGARERVERESVVCVE
jgi:perosamine synthetase